MSLSLFSGRFLCIELMKCNCKPQSEPSVSGPDSYEDEVIVQPETSNYILSGINIHQSKTLIFEEYQFSAASFSLPLKLKFTSRLSTLVDCEQYFNCCTTLLHFKGTAKIEYCSSYGT